VAQPTVSKHWSSGPMKAGLILWNVDMLLYIETSTTCRNMSAVWTAHVQWTGSYRSVAPTVLLTSRLVMPAVTTSSTKTQYVALLFLTLSSTKAYIKIKYGY